WYKDGRVDQAWILGKNENWGSFFVDAGQPGWQKLMVDLAGESIRQGFDGVFLDTVDTVDVYSKTKPGMIALIHQLRTAYPQALLVMNRGFSVVDQVKSDVDAVMFEDLSTTYNFESKQYGYADDTATALAMATLSQNTGMPILALDYAPPDNPAMAYRAVQISRKYGFIPAVSVINLDKIVDYGLERGGPADIRVSSINVEGAPDAFTLVVRVENTGLSRAVQVPFLLREGGDEIATLTRDLDIGEVFDWKIPVPQPKAGTHFTATALVTDATPLDNAVPWTFTEAALKLEPLLPLAQQRHRSNPNTPDLSAAQVAQPVTIDGDLGEWKGLPCFDANRADQVSFGDPAQWGGPQDLSGRVCYAWDAQNLYVGFQIWDDQIVQVNSGANLWQGDHVELWFDTQLQLDFDSDQPGADDFQVGVSPGDFKAVKPDFYIFTPAMAPSSWQGQVEYAVIPTADGYTGEVKLPAAVLRGLRLFPDNTIGVSFEPSDTDTPGASAQEMMISLAPKSSGQWGNPTNWNNLTLKGAAGSPTATPAP
ncbi:MAG TPA: sugar-binding protein, partial [Polyangia bacterium]